MVGRHGTNGVCGKSVMRKFLSILLLVSTSLAGSGDGWCAEGWARPTTEDPTCPDITIYRQTGCAKDDVTDDLPGLIWVGITHCFSALPGPSGNPIVRDLSEITGGVWGAPAVGDGRIPSYEEWNPIATPVAMGCILTTTDNAREECWGSGPSSLTSIEASTFWPVSSAAASYISNVDLNTDPLYSWPLTSPSSTSGRCATANWHLLRSRDWPLMAPWALEHPKPHGPVEAGAPTLPEKVDREVPYRFGSPLDR